MLTADRVVPTTCPYCGVGCQIDMHIKDELIYRVNGRFDNDVNGGNLCVKGRFGFDFVHAHDRLTHPLVKNSHISAHGNSTDSTAPFVTTSWSDALKQVATTLGQVRDQYGPDAIAVLTSAKCTNEENYLLQKFARAVIGTNTVDHCARL